ncbi:basic region leucin zipper protein [Roridomyces roridus]|uniref:Basic region leucin zipper protein n=1 Tax=Roridomyces roridus TaxID=1738132 RepID=A0AAD7BGG5_9AGAR|nr:basic region leucin zipper protein [Roridomyces roridus]
MESTLTGALTSESMARGRKKDLTIPLTRGLTMQRDYRARKSQYIADLEARCKAAEEENAFLKRQLDIVRQGGSALGTSAPAPAQLRDILEIAADALSSFLRVEPSTGGTAASDPYSSAGLLESLTQPSSSIVRSESLCCGGYLSCEGPFFEGQEEGGDQ